MKEFLKTRWDGRQGNWVEGTNMTYRRRFILQYGFLLRLAVARRLDDPDCDLSEML